MHFVIYFQANSTTKLFNALSQRCFSPLKSSINYNNIHLDKLQGLFTKYHELENSCYYDVPDFNECYLIINLGLCVCLVPLYLETL